MRTKFLQPVLLCLLLSCTQQKKNDPPAATIPAAKMNTVKHEKKFAGIAFANTKDYICGMPLTAGVEDTTSYKGKLYGFCSAECKDEFIKNPGQYLAAGK